MGILRDFENRLAAGVEGFFARVFRSRLQPVELAKAVQRYAGDYQQVGVRGIIVPNVYRFVLSPADMERFGGFSDALEQELAEVIQRTADERGWRLEGPARIELTEADHIRVGTYELRGKVEAAPSHRRSGSPQQPPQEQQSGSTRIMPAVGGGPGQAPSAHLRARTGEHYPLNGDTAVLGRLPSCDVTLSDPSVSRRHARIIRRDGEWVVEDLGSTNGVSVNGERLEQARLRDGDRLEFGSVTLTFSHGG